MSNFKTGDLVVCVQAFTDPRIPMRGADYPKKDQVYTVQAVTSTKTKCGYHGLILQELYCGGVGYSEKQFRKVDRHTFTNKLTKELASTKPVEERIEKPQPQEV